MKFKVSENAYWDNDKQTQSTNALNWLQSIRQSPANEVKKDNYGRPYLWTWKTPYATITVEHTFVFPNSTDWSMDKCIIKVNKK